MTVDQFFVAIAEANRLVPGVHTLNPGASLEMLDQWQRSHAVALPNDLLSLLRRSNGVDLHQSWHDGEPIYARGGFFLYALHEIQAAALAMYGGDDRERPLMSSWLAIGEGPDGTIFFIFDTATRHYLTAGPILPHEAEDVGPEIGPILDLVAPAAVDP